MSDAPVQLVVAAFQEEEAADQALKELKAAQRDKLIDIQDAAVIRRGDRSYWRSGRCRGRSRSWRAGWWCDGQSD
jgi:hypothetical protein